MKKKIKPAPTIATEPRLRIVEELARERIAEIKQDDLMEGSEASATVSHDIQTLEEDVCRGTKVIKGAISGHASTYGTSEQKQSKRERICHTYNEVKAAHPDWLEKQIENKVSEKLSIGIRTVQRYKNPPTQ